MAVEVVDLVVDQLCGAPLVHGGRRVAVQDRGFDGDPAGRRADGATHRPARSYARPQWRPGPCWRSSRRGDAQIPEKSKGTRAYQQLPCSTDAFVWLRLYQEETRRDGIPRGKSLPLWWTLRRPWRPLNYDAARAMFNRANDLLGANWTLHDLRHTASYRLARDPNMPLTDVQWVLGHAHLTTTQLYLNPRELHQTGEEPQVARSRREAEGLQRYYELAA